MRPIYRWSGEYFGFVGDTGGLFDARGRYLGWVADDGKVWDVYGNYLGDLVEGGYVLREFLATIPAVRRRPAPAAEPAPPSPGAPRPPRPQRPTHFDALDVFPSA
ncbi:MAG TPA: hypothetical protein VKE74_04010 [Gemmataceae bacterium]|nr:hypothetical protein [Gemmataceae bacterium]